METVLYFMFFIPNVRPVRGKPLDPEGVFDLKSFERRTRAEQSNEMSIFEIQLLGR
jgi:hypothetical protein